MQVRQILEPKYSLRKTFLTMPLSSKIWHLLRQSVLFEKFSRSLFASCICWAEEALYNCWQRLSSSSISCVIIILDIYLTYSIWREQKITKTREINSKKIFHWIKKIKNNSTKLIFKIMIHKCGKKKLIIIVVSNALQKKICIFFFL